MKKKFVQQKSKVMADCPSLIGMTYRLVKWLGLLGNISQWHFFTGAIFIHNRYEILYYSPLTGSKDFTDHTDERH